MLNKKAIIRATLSVALLLLSTAATPARTEVAGLTTAPDLSKLALSFVPNAGQTDLAVRFQAQGMGGTLFFTPGEVVLSLPAPSPARDSKASPTTLQQIRNPESQIPNSSVVRLHFEGANPEAAVTGAERLPGIVNYFIGNDPAKWRTNLPTYAGIVYQQLYPGIDLHYDGTEGVLKGTYTVAPGADPARIGWRYEGATAVRVDEATGDLLIELPSPDVGRGAGACPEPSRRGEGQGHTLTEQAPTAWQLINGQPVPVTARYTISADGSIGFALGGYDSARALVIDPTLNYSTFVGGSSDDRGWALALDGAGNAVVTGWTGSSDFPTVAGAYDASYSGGSYDVFVLKLAADGTSLLYSTFVGGNSDDRGQALDLDGAGNAVVMGYTESSDFPTTAGAYDTSHNGITDVFVLKLAPDGGSLLHSTLLGGSSNDAPQGLALDGAGNAVVTGFTSSSNFPTTAGAYDTAHNGGEWDAFIFKLAADGGALLYSTFVGGNADDMGCAVAVDGEGNVVATAQTLSSNFPTTAGAYDTSPNGGWDLFVLKLAADGGSLLYSTLVGGSGRDDAQGLALDSAGNAVVAGITWSSNFPTTAGAYDTSYNGGTYDVFALKLATDGGSLLYSTFLGGSGDESAYGSFTLPLDAAGNALITGWTGSSDFSTTAGAYDTSHNGNRDVFISKLAADGGSLLYSTFVGGSSDDEGCALALDGSGNAVVTGFTQSSNFPTTAGAYDTTHIGGRDVFVLRFDGLGDPLSLVWIDPPEKSVYPDSEPFTITVAISNVVDLAGFQFTMAFSPTIVHVEDAVLGDFLGSTGRTASPVGPDIDNEAGTVAFGAYSIGTVAAPEGSGVLAILALSPQASGITDLHLQNVQVGNTVPEAIPVSTQDGHVRVCMFGDFDCNCKIDIVDIMLVAIHWNTFVGDPDYDPIYDIDGDGDIDIMDILLAVVHWGETCE